MVKTSIVILTCNSFKFIGPCLESVFNQDCQGFEVIVVDNGSLDGTVDFIKENYPSIVIIENKYNLGACKARNQAIEIASGTWIVTLDCDTVLKIDFLSHIVKAIENLPSNVGIIQPKILNEYGKTIYSTGIRLSFLRRFYDIGRGRDDNGNFNSPKYIFGACVAAAVYRRKVLEEIKEDTGYFDERFFFLVEDVDLSWRAQRKGWQALFYPEAVCFHKGNSSNTDEKTRKYLCFRNRRLLISKNDELSTTIKRMPFYLAYDLPRAIFFLIKYKGDFSFLAENKHCLKI